MSVQYPAVIIFIFTWRSLSLLYPFSGSLNVVFFGIFDFEPDFFIWNAQKFAKKFFVDSKFCRLEIFPNQIFQNYDFGLLINIYLYKVKIYLLRSCSTWLANMINLIWCSHSGPDPVRWCGDFPGSYPDETYFCHFFAPFYSRAALNS